MVPKVCLVIPPSGFLLDERVFLTLGVLKVAACLERAGRPVDVLDLSGVSNYIDAAKTYATENTGIIYGFTATTPQMPAAVKILHAIRDVSPPVRTILGGPHVTLVHAAARREEKKGIQGSRGVKSLDILKDIFDVLVVGDGEEAIFEALRPNAVKLVDADNPQGLLFLTNKTLEQTPLPARHLVDVASYHYTIEGAPALSMIAQLGCPFACAFCGGRESSMLRKIRTRSTESVVAEVRHLYTNYGVTGIMFYDDELNVNKQVVELMQAIADEGKRLGVEWRLRGFVKSELFTDKQAEAMYAAGFRWILVGFESGSPRILDNINKKATREDNTRAVQTAKRHGLKVKALMSCGHAGESESTINDTRDWLLENKPDDFDLTVITTYPGTPYFDHAVESTPRVWTYTAPRTGDTLHAIETDFNESESYYKGVPGEYKSFVYTDFLSPEKIVEIRDRTEAEVREKLVIPFNPGSPGMRYEASMGQLPSHILRKSTV